MSIRALVLLALSAGLVPPGSAGSLRVHAGQLDSRNEFPFIVMFQTRFEPFMRGCSGSLIAPNWVISAAHCLAPSNLVIIRYGDFTLLPNKTKLYAKVIKNFKYSERGIFEDHPRPWSKGLRDDIGLVLIERIYNKPITRLLALDYRTLIGLPVKYAGFGLTSKSLYVHNDKLEKLATDVQFAPRVGEGVIAPCSGFQNIGPVVCVAAKCSNKAQAPRQGDSGGPVVYDGRIIGVCKTGNFTGSAYTPVSIYLEWIQAVMRSNSHLVR